MRIPRMLLVPLAAVAIAAIASCAAHAPRHAAATDHAATTDHAVRDAVVVGNGSVAMSMLFDPSGAVLLELRHADAFDEQGEPRALGVLRMSFEPPLDTARFERRFDARAGVLEAVAGEGDRAVRVRAFVDSDAPAAHVAIDAAAPRHVALALATPPARGGEPPVAGDIVIPVEEAPEALAWYHRNESSAQPSMLAARGFGDLATAFDDPLILRTFGARVEGDGFSRLGPLELRSDTPIRRGELRITASCVQADGLSGWIERLAKMAAVVPCTDEAERRTRAWWAERWPRGFVDCAGDDAAALARRRLEVLQSGDGRVPIGEGDPAPYESLARFGDADRIAPFARFEARLLRGRMAAAARDGAEGACIEWPPSVLGIGSCEGDAAARAVRVVALLLDERDFAGEQGAWPTHGLPVARALLANIAWRADAGELEPSRVAGLHEVASRMCESAAEAGVGGAELARWTRLRERSAAAPPMPARGDPLLARLLAEDGNRIVLLPDWPRARDVRFRLHARGAVVEAEARGGRLVRVVVEPAARRADLVAGPGWILPAE
ncbi:MAG: DUF5703 domain-containing protein [Planctomycetota bacterium]